LKTLMAAAAASVVFVAAPATAFAVSVSSNDGSGSQNISTWYPCGASTYGTLKSTSGNPVYYGGLSAFNNTPDEDWGRYTSDTSSRTAVSRGGRIGPTTNCADAHLFTGVKTHICRDRNNFPDGCGSWASLPK
jgi:hypothetical protein